MVGDEAPQEVVSASRSRGWLPAGRHWSGSLRFKGTGVRGDVVELLRMRAWLLVRRRWRATLFLSLLAGLAGGVAMAAFTVGRRASTAFDRFLAYSDAADLLVTFCPPELDRVDDETLRTCFFYDAVDEARIIARLPEVDVAGRVGYVGLTASFPSDPLQTWPANALVVFDAEPAAVDGAPIVVDGRRPDPAAVDEVAVNEQFAATTGLTVGDELDFTFWAEAEMGATAVEGERFSGPRLRATVVGIERNVRDLIGRVGTAIAGIEEHRVVAGRALAAEITEAGHFGGVAVVASNGDVGAAQAAIEGAFAGRLYNMSPNLDADDQDPIVDAIRYEAGGTLVFGAVTAFAAAAFAGQAVSRQSRREWSDGPTLRGLGMSNRDAAAAAGLRGAVTGAIAALIAAAVGIALSAAGPFGIAGRVEVDRGIVVDGVVVVAGGSAVLVVVTTATWWPVVRQFRRSATWPSIAQGSLHAVQTRLPPPAAAGLSMSINGRGAGGLPTGTAIAGVALAIIAAIAAVGVASSFDALTTTPARFGAPWHLSASAAVGEQGESSPVAELLAADPDVDAAAGIVGTDALIGDEIAWVHAFRPVEGVDGLISPVIVDGRAPAAIDEIALGARTMADQGVSIGDSIEIQPATSAPNDDSRVIVVGTTVVNDSFENNPGRGGVVTAEWIERYADELTPDPFVVRLQPGIDVEQFRTKLEAVATAGVNGPVRQGAIRNLERVGWVPFLLAVLVGVLAVASLAHAIVLSMRRQRGQLAILKSLGFRRGQVRAAVACHASILAVVAAIIGAPLGIILGRWAWRIVADGLGVASPPVTPVLAVTSIVVGALVVANLVAAYPAWQAAREPTARHARGVTDGFGRGSPGTPARWAFPTSSPDPEPAHDRNLRQQ